MKIDNMVVDHLMYEVMNQLRIWQYKEKDTILINNSILKGLESGMGWGSERSWMEGGGGGDCWCLYDLILVRSLKISRAMQIRYFQIITKVPHKYYLDKSIMKSIQKLILAIALHKQNNF